MTAPAARSTADRRAADRQAAVDAYTSGQQRLIEIAAAYQVTSKTVLEWVRQAGRPLRGSAARAPHTNGLDLDPRRSPDRQPAEGAPRDPDPHHHPDPHDSVEPQHSADPQRFPDPQRYADPQRSADPLRYVDPQRAAAVAAYLDGTGVQEIVQTLGVPRATVVAWLRAAGVPLRPADGGPPHVDPGPAKNPGPSENPEPVEGPVPTGAATRDVAGQSEPSPGAPTTGEVALVQATAERGRIALRWEAREADIRQFHVEVSRADKKDWRTVGTTDAGQTTLEWRKAKKGKEYRFRVRATTTAGPGPWSRPVKVAAR